MKVYLLFRDNGFYEQDTLVKIYSTEEKANYYRDKLNKLENEYFVECWEVDKFVPEPSYGCGHNKEIINILNEDVL